MQIVIDIPEQIYKELTETAIIVTEAYPLTIERALTEGIALPKGHGRLVDADELIKDFKLSRAMSVDERLKAACIVNHAYDKRCLVEADKEVDDAELQSNP